MRMPPLLADFIHVRVCKTKVRKILDTTKIRMSTITTVSLLHNFQLSAEYLRKEVPITTRWF